MPIETKTIKQAAKMNVNAERLIFPSDKLGKAECTAEPATLSGALDDDEELFESGVISEAFDSRPTAP